MIEAIREEWKWQRERKKKFEVKGISRGREKSGGKAEWNKSVRVRATRWIQERENRAGREKLTGETDLYCAMCSSDVSRGIRM